MNAGRPTPDDIDVLLAYLPRLYAAGFRPVESWNGGQQTDGSITLPYPNYHPLVVEFFGHVSADGWLDRDYDPEQAGQMLRDEGLVKAATLLEIRRMLTFCVRGERFADGHWGEMIEGGYVRRLLERLQVLREL